MIALKDDCVFQRSSAGSVGESLGRLSVERMGLDVIDTEEEEGEEEKEEEEGEEGRSGKIKEKTKETGEARKRSERDQATLSFELVCWLSFHFIIIIIINY